MTASAPSPPVLSQKSEIWNYPSLQHHSQSFHLQRAKSLPSAGYPMLALAAAAAPSNPQFPQSACGPNDGCWESSPCREPDYKEVPQNESKYETLLSSDQTLSDHSYPQQPIVPLSYTLSHVHHQEPKGHVSTTVMDSMESLSTSPSELSSRIASAYNNDPIVQRIIAERSSGNLLEDPLEIERRQRMYNMIRHSSHYKKIQIESANSKWDDDIHAALQSFSDSQTSNTNDTQASPEYSQKRTGSLCCASEESETSSSPAMLAPQDQGNSNVITSPPLYPPRFVSPIDTRPSGMSFSVEGPSVLRLRTMGTMSSFMTPSAGLPVNSIPYGVGGFHHIPMTNPTRQSRRVSFSNNVCVIDPPNREGGASVIHMIPQYREDMDSVCRSSTSSASPDMASNPITSSQYEMKPIPREASTCTDTSALDSTTLPSLHPESSSEYEATAKDHHHPTTHIPLSLKKFSMQIKKMFRHA